MVTTSRVPVPPSIVRQLRAVFGDCVPKTNAAALLESSPFAPVGADLAALKAVLGDVAGQKLPASSTSTAPRSVAQASMEHVQARRDAANVLSPSKLAEVWASVAAMKDVPFSFLEEGCVDRSHVVAKRLEDAGVFCEKVFCIPLGADLVMTAPKDDRHKSGETVCWYHEAVVVTTQTKDGPERRVLDPSVADRPLTVEEWTSTMRPARAGVALETFFLPRFAYGLGDRDSPPTTWDVKGLEQAFAWNTEWRDSQKRLVESGFYEGLPELLANPVGGP